MAELAVSDWPRAVEWHRAALGLSVELLDEANRFALLTRPDGSGARLALKAGTPRPGGVILHWQVADLDAELQRLQGLGIGVGEVTASAEGYRRAAVLDPDGYEHGLFAWATNFEGHTMTRCVDVFCACVEAMDRVALLNRTKEDKEFHFQNWFAARLDDRSIAFDRLKRNAYPDFVLASPAEGYEVKGLENPGRGGRDFDCNSQVPKGYFNQRAIFYVFGRYPKWEPGTTAYPVTDLILCHGDFLNADRQPLPKNESIRGFGSYGDLLVRDRKMYVAPTPFALTDGTIGNRTLILPDSIAVDDSRVEAVGRLTRIETARSLAAYTFDFPSDALAGTFVPNPRRGTEHGFVAYRVKGAGGDAVTMRARADPADPGHRR